MRDIEELLRIKCGDDMVSGYEGYDKEDVQHDSCVESVNHQHDDMCCEECLVHEDVVQEVKKSVPSDEKLKAVANLYKKFSDFTRVKIMYMLSVSEMCVCDLSDVLDMSQPAVSNHLKVLKEANLIKGRRDGKMIYYSLADSHVETILAQGLEHVEE